MNRVDVVELVVDLVDVDLDVDLVGVNLDVDLVDVDLDVIPFVHVALRAASILKNHDFENHDFENLKIEFGCFRWTLQTRSTFE